MEYFVYTNQLLVEPEFLKFAQEEYETFISLDRDDYTERHSRGERFEFNLKGWQNIIEKKEPLRPVLGGVGPFLLYVRLEAQKLLYKDWEAFHGGIPHLVESNRNPAIKEFLQQAETVRSTIASRAYLKPLQDWLYETLDSINTQYKAISPSSNKSKVMAKDNEDIAPIQWNGGKAVFLELIRDLMAARTKDNKPYLSMGLPQLVRFISEHFVDEKGNPFEETTVAKYLYNKDKRVAKKITLTLPE